MNNLDEIRRRYKITTVPATTADTSESTTVTLSPDDLLDLCRDMPCLISELEYMRSIVMSENWRAGHALLEHQINAVRKAMGASLANTGTELAVLVAGEGVIHPGVAKHFEGVGFVVTPEGAGGLRFQRRAP